MRQGLAPLITILIVIAAFLLAGVVWYILAHQSAFPSDHIVCTQEAMLCPDGSYVGRTGPKCEFAECPSSNSNTSTSTGSNTQNPRGSGAFCGGIAGFQCAVGYSCILDGTYPDAGGKCTIAKPSSIGNSPICEPTFPIESGPELTASQAYGVQCAKQTSTAACNSLDIYDAKNNSFGNSDGIPDCKWKTNERVCTQVITPAKNITTGEIHDFPTPCDVPEGWEAVH